MLDKCFKKNPSNLLRNTHTPDPVLRVFDALLQKKKTLGGANAKVPHLEVTQTDDIDYEIQQYMKTNNIQTKHILVGSGAYGKVFAGTCKDGQNCVLKFITNCNNEIGLNEYVMSCREVDIGSDLAMHNIAPRIYYAHLFISTQNYAYIQNNLPQSQLSDLNLQDLPDDARAITFKATVLIVQENGGETLETYLQTIAQDTPKNTDRRKILARMILQNVSTLHREKYAHRDLKPSNLFVQTSTNNNNEPLKLFIGDYGLAVNSNSNRKTSITSTYYYWGPEMTNAVTAEDMQKVDSWSVGMILLELLYGAKEERSSEFSKNKNSNTLTQANISTYLENTCTENKYKISNHLHLKNIIHKLLIYDPLNRLTVTDALTEFNKIFPPPAPASSTDKKKATMKIAFTLALLTATAMLMAKGNKKNTRRQLFTQKRQRSAA